VDVEIDNLRELEVASERMGTWILYSSKGLCLLYRYNDGAVLHVEIAFEAERDLIEILVMLDIDTNFVKEVDPNYCLK